MIPEDFLPDYRVHSTDNNEYATGINDENEWEENIIDEDVPIADYIDDPTDEEGIYNETGFDRERVN